MSDNPQEAEARALLKSSGAVMVRRSGNGHEVWRLSNGRNFVCNKETSSSGIWAWRNNLSTLKRLLREAQAAPPEKAQQEIATRAEVDRRWGWDRLHGGEVPSNETPPLIAPPTVVEVAVPGDQPMVAKSKDGGWTQEQDQLLLEAYNDKFSKSELVKFMQESGRPHATLPAIIQRLNRLKKRAAKGKGRGLAALLPGAPEPTRAPALATPAREDVIEVTFQSARGLIAFKVDRETANAMASLALKSI